LTRCLKINPILHFYQTSDCKSRSIFTLG
jgi:hypothetical protein